MSPLSRCDIEVYFLKARQLVHRVGESYLSICGLEQSSVGHSIMGTHSREPFRSFLYKCPDRSYSRSLFSLGNELALHLSLGYVLCFFAAFTSQGAIRTNVLFKKPAFVISYIISNALPGINMIPHLFHPCSLIPPPPLTRKAAATS